MANVSSKARRLLLSSVKIAAEAADRVRPPVQGLTVLIYHRIGARTLSEVDLPADAFDSQMAALASQGRAVSMDQALTWLGGEMQVPDRPVLVTFDDGTADFIEIAMPILERHRIPAMLYLATDFIERQRVFPGEGRPVSWAGLRDGLTTGLVTVGSHTHTHALVDRATPAEAMAEFVTSQKLIEDRLGVTAPDFAYPKALLAGPAVESVVRRRFRSAAVGGNRANPAGRTDLYRLSRSAIQTTDGMRWFERKVDGGMALEDALRRRINRRRYQRLTT